MKLSTFAAPGGLKDLTARGLKGWSSAVDELLTSNVAGDRRTPNDHPRPQFFNPLNVQLKPEPQVKVMRWGAFPRKLARLPTPQRWEMAEARGRQEEYCEWSAEKDRNGRILRAFFTTEVPSYFHLLAADAPKKLLAVYRKHVSPDVQERDLISPSGSYRPNNEWNRRGAMHMVQPNNTLDAAVLLVAQSTIVRGRKGVLKTNANDLIRCGVAADIDRNSDPLIVGSVNELARAGALISLQDPVGLYLDSLQTTGWLTPDGSDAREFWKVTRGGPNHALRAVFEVPKARKFGVSDIRINGRPIQSPSQIAEFIQVRVVGIAHEPGKHLAQPRGCQTDPDGGLEAVGGRGALLSVSDLMAAARSQR